MVTAKELRPGVVEVTIQAGRYGQAGTHWRRILSGKHHGGYGRIFIQRFGANHRRYLNCYNLRDVYRGELGANLDECPGAMFEWDGKLEAHVEPIDAIDNQSLGRAMGIALRPYKQLDANDLWEVVFRFV